MPSKEHFLIASEELTSGRFDQALFAQAKSLAMGSSSKEAAIYVQLRAEELARMESAEKTRSFFHGLKSLALGSRRPILSLIVVAVAIALVSTAWKVGNDYLRKARLTSELAQKKVALSQQLKEQSIAWEKLAALIRAHRGEIPESCLTIGFDCPWKDDVVPPDSYDYGIGLLKFDIYLLESEIESKSP